MVGYMTEHARRMLADTARLDLASSIRCNLHTAAPTTGWRDSGLRVAGPSAWSRRPARPGPLVDYESRVEHARAHRLASERRRRDRRRARQGRPNPTLRFGTPAISYATISVDLSGWNAAMARISEVFRQMGESLSNLRFPDLSAFATTAGHFDRDLASEDETTASDSLDCSATGARWSDLIANIDELINES